MNKTYPYPFSIKSSEVCKSLNASILSSLGFAGIVQSKFDKLLFTGSLTYQKDKRLQQNISWIYKTAQKIEICDS